MRLWWIILIYALAEAQGPISEVSSLDVQAATTFPGLTLSSYIIGSGVTYGVSGSYRQIDGTPLTPGIPPPTITQGMSPTTSFKKSSAGQSQASVGLQPDPLYPNIVFSANSETLVAYDMNLYQQVAGPTSLGYSIGAIYTFVSQGQTVIATVCTYSQGISFIFSTYGPSGFTIVGNPQKFPFVYGFTGALFKTNLDIINCYVWGTGGLQVFSFSPVSPFTVSSGNSLTASNFPMISSFSPVSFLIYQKAFGIVCDSNAGILVFNATSWLNTGQVNLLSSSKDPLIDQSNLLSCTADQLYVYVATSTTQYAYEFAFSYKTGFGLALKTGFSYESDGNMISVSGFSSNVASGTLSFLVSTVNLITTTDSFRVLINNPNINSYGFMLYDISLCKLITLSECYKSATPAFRVLSTSADSFDLVMDAYYNVYVFTCYTGAYFNLVPGLTDSFIFNGVLTASNSNNIKEYKLTITAWNPASTTIYTTRNILSNDGFEASTNISLYLNSENSVSAEVYLPLSNYFSGQNILYDVTLAPGSPEYVNVTTPPVLSLTASYTFQSQSPKLMNKLEFNGLTVIAVLSNNTVVLFDGYAQDLTPLGVVSPHKPEYQIMQFVCVIQQYSDISMLVVESQMANGIDGYSIDWDLFDISDPSNVRYETTMNFQSDGLFGQLEGKNSTLFSMRLGSIFVAEAAYNGSYTLTSLTPINSGSIGIPAFNPVKICVEVGNPQIYIYDANLGILVVTPASGYTSYSFTNITLQFYSNPSAVRLLSYNDTLYLLDPANLNQPLISILYDSPSITVFPNFANATYLSLQISYNYLAVLSNFLGTQTVLIFNLVARSQIRNLIAMVPVPPGSSFCFFTTSNDRYSIYHYDGETLVRWELGQTDAVWQPSSISMPTLFHEYTVWSKVRFIFPDLSNEPFYNATVIITATSGITQETTSTSVSIVLVNQGTFLTTNSSYNSPSQLTTPGILSVSDTQQFTIPDGFFTGADITYAFALNGNQGALILPQAVCTPKLSFVCINSKQYLCQNCVKGPDKVLDFDVTEDFIYFASIGAIWRVPLQNGTSSKYDINQLLDTSSSYCYLIQAVDGLENFVIAMCEGYAYQYMGEFLLFLDFDNKKNSFGFLVSIRALSMNAAYNSITTDLTVFLTDTSRVLVIVHQFSSSTTYVYSIITDQMLGLTYPITPMSVGYINDHNILVADANTGDMFLLEMTSTEQYSYQYKIVQTLYPYPGFNSTSGIVSICLGPSDTVFALTKGATIYQYLLKNQEDGSLFLQLIATVPPVAEDLDQYIMIDTLDVDVTGNYVVYPVYDGTDCRIRVVNMSAPLQSRIYTSTDAFYSSLPTQLYATGSVKIMNQTDTQLTVAVSLATETLDHPIFQIFIIRLQTQAFIFPQSIESSLNHFVTLQLVALNSLSKALAPQITLNFSS